MRIRRLSASAEHNKHSQPTGHYKPAKLQKNRRKLHCRPPSRQYEQNIKSWKPLLHAYPRIRPTIAMSEPPAATPHSWKGPPMNDAAPFVGLDGHTRSKGAASRPREGASPESRGGGRPGQHMLEEEALTFRLEAELGPAAEPARQALRRARALHPCRRQPDVRTHRAEVELRLPAGRPPATARPSGTRSAAGATPTWRRGGF